MRSAARVLHHVFHPSALLACLLLSACGSDIPADPNLSVIQVHAHRGGSSLRPENSMSAFQTAVGQVGADAIELDIRQTADQMLVINHDAVLAPDHCLAPGGLRAQTIPKISQMTLAEIRRFDCGTPRGLAPKTPLPTLDEVFTSIERTRTPAGGMPVYDLHVKWDPATIDAPTYAKLILDVIRQHAVLDRINLMNESPVFLQAAQQLEPSVRLFYLVNKVTDADIAAALPLKVDAFVARGRDLNAAIVAKLHALGFKVIPWTVNQPYAWDSLFKMGVDGIMTDNPVGLRERLKGHHPTSALSASRR